MYQIHKNTDHLLVEFREDFNHLVVQAIIHHETMMKEYSDTNDIWLIGQHRADIRLGELELMVRDFQCCCPENATRSKTAIVVSEGLTGAILELWVNALQKRVPFDMQIFATLEEAEDWIEVATAEMT